MRRWIAVTLATSAALVVACGEEAATDDQPSEQLVDAVSESTGVTTSSTTTVICNYQSDLTCRNRPVGALCMTNPFGQATGGQCKPTQWLNLGAVCECIPPGGGGSSSGTLTP